MLVIPAIDIREGKVVRLTQGSFDEQIAYSLAPADVMQKWQHEGAKLVHVVDLDGAKEGVRRNLGSLKNILAVAKVPIQFGGGLRSYEAVSEILKAGVWRAVLGTKATDNDLIKTLAREFGGRIAVSLDIRDGFIQTHGWQKSERRITLEAICPRLEKVGIQTVICTDVRRDGMLSGPNIELLNQVLKITKMKVILSGGVADLKDLKQLSQIRAKNFEGVIVGKALYEQRMTLREVMAELESHGA